MSRRLVVIAVIVAVLVGGAIIDRRPRPGLPPAPSLPGQDMPVAAPASALSSSWYCVAGGGGDTSIVIANPTDASVRGRVTVVGNNGARASTAVVVPPVGRVTVNEKDLLSSPYAAALVDLDGGEVVAEQLLVTAAGTMSTPCASATSDHWYLADGSTAKDATLLVALFNPFADDAIVDFTFSTEQGPTTPIDFQGVVVPAHGLLMADIGAHVRRRDHVATAMAVRTGRIVAAGIQTFAAGSPRKGAAVVLAAPSLGHTWLFPDGYVAPGITERFWIYNPTRTDAEVELVLDLERGSAEPFDLTVRAGADLALTVNGESRVPPAVPHAARLRSTNGVPFVVARSIDVTAPSPRSGYSSTVGARQTAKRWLLAAGGPTETLDEWVVVQNPGDRAVTIAVRGLADRQLLPVEGLQNVVIPPHGRQAFRLGDHLKRAALPVLVTADGPVVVERELYGVKAPGINSVIGVPLP
jgi:hypothetical protein